MLLDYHLTIQPVAFQAARAFVNHHHVHCSAPVTWRFAASIFNGNTMLGVALVGNPVARALCGRGTLEVNRLCIRRNLPQALAWNAASQLLGWCAKEAQRQGSNHIITYTRVDEQGVSLRAAGWTQECVVRGRGWHHGVRARSNRNAYIDKIRWGRALKSRPTPVRPPCERIKIHPSCLTAALFANTDASPPCAQDPCQTFRSLRSG